MAKLDIYIETTDFLLSIWCGPKDFLYANIYQISYVLIKHTPRAAFDKRVGGAKEPLCDTSDAQETLKKNSVPLN